MLIGGAGLTILLIDKSFSFKDTFRFSKIKHVKFRLLVLVASFFISSCLLLILEPSMYLRFFKEFPIFALILPPLYTLFSVVPQTVVYRVLFFHRYAHIFKTKNEKLFASALVFSFAHIVMLNAPALILTFIGGIFFSKFYLKDKSILGSVLEHGAHGSLLFILGFGVYLYSGFDNIPIE